MKKTILLLALLILSVFVLTACGDTQDEVIPETPVSEQQDVTNGSTSEPAPAGTEPVDSDDEGAAPVEDGPNSVQDFSFMFGDVLIEMDQNIDYVLANLGEPLGVLERPSCAFDGMDIIYGYPDVEIFTYPKGDTNHVHTINFINDSPRTTEGGIRMGAVLQDVLNAYGDDFEYDTGMYIFTRGLTTLSFFIDDGIVWGITYGFIIE